jgi:feruloyl esterase
VAIAAALTGSGWTPGAASAAAPAPTCSAASINALRVSTMTVTSATDVPAAAPNPEYCDVRGSVDTGGNQARFRIQLPVNWNQKLLFYGVGGTGGSELASSANPVDSAAALSKGYATAITDTGHQNTNNADTSFALTAPGSVNKNALNDYLFRAAHEVTVAAKELLKRFYGTRPARAYFDGCSNGGRMGLIEATRYPKDYDGIIAGDPTVTQLQVLALLKGAKAFLNPAGARIPVAMLPVIDAAYTSSCDAVDGVMDGLVQNTARCSFDPQTLVCAGGNASNCLTPNQATGLKNYLRPLTDEKGNVVVRAFSGSDLSEGNIQTYALGPNAPIDPNAAEPWGTLAPARGWALGDTFVKNVVERDPDFNTQDFQVSLDGVVARDALKLYTSRTQNGTADNPDDYKDFLKGGRKLIIYHGLGDKALSPYVSMKLYEGLAEKQGGYDRLQQSARLFLAPGMQHCGGGHGPNSFDTLTALEQWVEHGMAPDSLLATHFVNNNRSLPADRTMPLCTFPTQATYRGSGNVNDAANWSCVPNERMLEIGTEGAQAGVGSD